MACVKHGSGIQCLERHAKQIDQMLVQKAKGCGGRAFQAGLVPRPPLQKPPSRGLEASGGEGGGGGRRSEGRRGLHLRRLEGGLKAASRGLEGGFKGVEGGFKEPSP